MSAPERWPEVKALFEAAQDVDATSRERWLQDRCGHDPLLFAEVNSLLDFDVRPHPLFERSHPGLAALLDEDREDLQPGDSVGLYAIERRLGRGGMGAVYLASRSDGEMRQRVAIKIIKRGMDSAEIVRRFRLERQALANFNHPHIAMLLDGGRTDDGLPYFAMEYVEGEPIDDYCDRRKLALEDRLRLMLRVCSAVQHAHQHLVVHRDLKPDNVMVRADGEPKLLDFGIAKMLEGEEGAEATSTGTRPMTLRYASPEQIRGAPVTTSTDIYSLGVLLYQVLTGRLPYAASATAGTDLERAIADEAPLPVRTAALHDTDAATPWRRRIPPDLEAIVMTALRKEPARRYPSVEQLADDIQRFLRGLPVHAQPDTVRYRASKFVRRHRLAAAAGAVAILTLLVAIPVVAWQARVARHEAAAAVEQARQAAAERERAKAEAVRAQRVSTFLTSVLELADPNWYAAGAGRPRDLTVTTLLRAAGTRIDTELRDYPDVAADVHHTVGNTYRALGFYADAERHFGAALARRRSILPPVHPKIAESLYFQASMHLILQREGEADKGFRQALEVARALPFESATLLPYILMDLTAVVPVDRLDEAERLAHEALNIFRRRNGDAHITVVFAKGPLVKIHMLKNELDEAARLGEETIADLRRLKGPNAVDVRGALELLAEVRMRQRRFGEADRLLREAGEIVARALGPDHPLAAHSLRLRATGLSAAGRHREAETLARRSLAVLGQRLEPGSSGLVKTLADLGNILTAGGKPLEGERHLRESLRILADQAPPDRCEVANAKLGLAVPLAAQGRVEESRRVADDAFAAVRQHCPPDGIRSRAARAFVEQQLPTRLARAGPRRAVR